MNANSSVPISERKILVTGASRGIGKAITERLLFDGANVVGIGRDFSTWRQLPARFDTLKLDLAQLNTLPTALKALIKQHPDIDAVICNAGHGRFGALEQFSPPQIRGQIELNLTQHILIARFFIPVLKRRGFGDLLFMGSESALQGGRNGAVYSACKFALRGLAQSLRLECASNGVRVGIINPGMVDTNFFDDLDFRPGDQPENHIRPADIAEAVYMALNAPPGTVLDEITLSPLKQVIQFGGKS